MKRDCLKLLPLAVLAALLVSCGADKTAASGGVDYNQYLNCPGYYGCTDTAWYICPDMQVYFLDSSLKAPVTLLCSRADCAHNDREECSSYLPAGSYTIYAWNNTLYYLCVPPDFSGLGLYRMGPDGQDRKCLAVLEEDVSSFSYTARAGGGYLALNFCAATTEGDVTTLRLYSLADPEAEPLVLFSNAEQVSAPGAVQEELPTSYPVHLGEDWAFYAVTQGPAGQRQCSLYGYQISTGETSLLLEDGFSAVDDLSPQGETLRWYDADGALYEIGLASGEVRRLAEFPVEEGIYGTMDDRWLYLTGGAELVVCDLEGHEVQRLDCDALGFAPSYAFSSGDKVFFRNGDLLGSVEPVCWLDKEAIAKGKAEFVTLPD